MDQPQCSSKKDGVSWIPNSREDDRDIKGVGVNDVDSGDDIHDNC